jgi:heat shock protein HtpX
MELCVDNPREGFADLFATHPSVEARIQALVKFAGGRDPGPLALPSEAEEPVDTAGDPPDGNAPPSLPPSGPWSHANAPGGAGPEQAPSQGPWTRPAMGPWSRS